MDRMGRRNREVWRSIMSATTIIIAVFVGICIAAFIVDADDF